MDGGELQPFCGGLLGGPPSSSDGEPRISPRGLTIIFPVVYLGLVPSNQYPRPHVFIQPMYPRKIFKLGPQTPVNASLRLRSFGIKLASRCLIYHKSSTLAMASISSSKLSSLLGLPGVPEGSFS